MGFRRFAWMATLVACGEQPAQTLEVPKGSWSRGDVHVHSSVASNDTDGQGLIGAIRPAMDRAGLDFLVITDHSNAAGSMHCGDVEDCPNLGPELPVGDWPAGVWLGSEISPVASLDHSDDSPRGHVGCMPGEGGLMVDTFIDRPPGAVSGASAIEQCHDAGGWAILNHPFGLTSWVSFDWTSESFDAMEVFNGSGRFDASDVAAVEAWDARVALRPELVPVGASDCHRWGTEAPGTLTDPALGWPSLRVHVRGDETPLEALRAGRVRIEEPGTTVEIEAWGEQTVAIEGDRVEGPVRVKVRGTTTTPGRLLQLKQAGGEVLAEVGIDGEAELEVSVRPPAVVYARVWPNEPVTLHMGGVALSGVVVVAD